MRCEPRRLADTDPTEVSEATPRGIPARVITRSVELRPGGSHDMAGRINPAEQDAKRAELKWQLEEPTEISLGEMPLSPGDLEAVGALWNALRTGRAIPAARAAAIRALGSAKKVQTALAQFIRQTTAGGGRAALTTAADEMLAGAEAETAATKAAAKKQAATIRSRGVKARRAKLDTPEQAAARAETEAAEQARLAKNAKRRADAEARGSKLGRPKMSEEAKQKAMEKRLGYEMPQREGRPIETPTMRKNRIHREEMQQRRIAAMGESTGSAPEYPRTWKPKAGEIDPETLTDEQAEVLRQKLIAQQKAAARK